MIDQDQNKNGDFDSLHPAKVLKFSTLKLAPISTDLKKHKDPREERKKPHVVARMLQ